MPAASFSLYTDKQGMYDITPAVCETIRQRGMRSGQCLVFCPHTTAAGNHQRKRGSRRDQGFASRLGQGFSRQAGISSCRRQQRRASQGLLRWIKREPDR